MQIDIFSDMVCPWCRIGKKNLADALVLWNGTESVAIRHRAFQLDPSVPADGLPFTETMLRKAGSTDRLKQMLANVTDAGAAIGLRFCYDQVARMPNTHLAHRLVALLPEDEQGRMIDGVMTAYFEEGADIGREDVLLRLAETAGHDAEGLRQQLAAAGGADSVEADFAEAGRIGVTGVPFFVFNRRFALSGAYPAAELAKALKRIAGTEA